jgi:flagellar assembly FlgT-like protein
MKLFLPLFVILSCLLQVSCSGNNNKTETDAADSVTVESDNAVVSATGQAVIINGAVLEARRNAIQNAIESAMAKTSRVGSDVSLVANTKIVDEWQEQGRYLVQVLSVVTEGDFCKSPYRKRIVATAFPAVTSGQIAGTESQDLYGGIPREINNLLMESGDFIGRNQTDISLYSRPDQAPEIARSDAYSGSSIINIARQNDAQFVLSGVIRDFEVESTEYIRGAGFLAQIKSAFRDVVARRGITLDIYVHDGYTGALLFQHRYSDSILGDVWIPNGYSVGSERFNSTSAGNKINAIIRMASDDIRRIFGCYPFMARVVKVDSGGVVIAAGTQDKVRRGDNLVIYAASKATSGLGIPETNKEAIGMIKIDSVNAGYAVGKLEVPIGIRRVRVGDWVKSW